MLAPTARGVVVPNGYATVDPYNLLGAKPADMIPGFGIGGNLSAATTSLRDASSGKPWSPDNPLFWFGALLAVTVGLIGAATSVRVGPFKAAVAAGKP